METGPPPPARARPPSPHRFPRAGGAETLTIAPPRVGNSGSGQRQIHPRIHPRVPAAAAACARPPSAAGGPQDYLPRSSLPRSPPPNSISLSSLRLAYTSLFLPHFPSFTSPHTIPPPFLAENCLSRMLFTAGRALPRLVTDVAPLFGESSHELPRPTTSTVGRRGKARCWSRLVTAGHGWSRLVTAGHGWSRLVRAGHGW